jgi:hypothetical protein
MRRLAPTPIAASAARVLRAHPAWSASQFRHVPLRGRSKGNGDQPSHRSFPGQAILSGSTFVPALVSLPGVLRHAIALVRYLTGFVQPCGEGRFNLISGQLWPHFLTPWPPAAHQEVHFVSTQPRIALAC